MTNNVKKENTSDLSRYSLSTIDQTTVQANTSFLLVFASLSKQINVYSRTFKCDHLS